MSKFKVGDKVRILDGSKIKDYTATWCAGAMGKYVDEIHKVKEISTWYGKTAYMLEGCGPYKFDERGLELVHKFKVGDKVIGNEHADDIYSVTGKGWVGIVTENDPKKCDTGDDIKVRAIDEPDGANFSVKSVYFDLYEEPKTQKIVITNDGKTTTAVLYDGKKRIKDAKATCALTDKFDFGIGSALAIERLMGNPKATLPEDEKSKYFTGKVRCVNSRNPFITEGKIYDFVDGRSVDDVGDKLPLGGPIVSVDDLNARLYSDFEEVTDEKSDLLNVKIRIIDAGDSCDFKAGKTYEIKDGRFVGTEVDCYPYCGELRDFNDLKYYFSSNASMNTLKHSKNLSHHCGIGVKYQILKPIDWNKFAHGELEVKVSKEKYDELMKFCEEKNFVFKMGGHAIKWNPWNAYDKMPDFLKHLVEVFDDKPGEHVWVCTDGEGALKFTTKHSEGVDEYEFV